MRNALLLTLLFGTAHAGGVPAPILDPVPENAWVAGALKSSAFEVLRTYFTQTPEMQHDLGAFFVKRLGVDLTRIDGAAFWSTQQSGNPAFAFFIRLPQAAATQLKGKHRTSPEGIDLVQLDKQVVATSVAGGLILGDESEVRAGVAVAQHRSPGLSQSSPLGELLPQAGSSDLIAGLAASAVKDPQTRAMAEQYGMRTIILSMRGDGRITLEANGNGERLKNAAALLDATMRMVLAQLKVQHDQALADETMDFASGLGAVAGYHQVNALWKEAAPKIEGDKLVCRYQLPQMKSTAAMVVPLIGVASAVAIPAFMKYIRRSKSVEATMNVRKLADAVAAYQGKPLRSTEWTPAATCCSQGGKCAPNPKAWTGTFAALNFSVDDPHYYQYRVTKSGKKTVVEARGDLDCDGKFSNYKRTVTGTTVGPLESSDDIE
jgi:hypothetical protein